MRADQKLTLILVEREQLIVIGVALLMAVKVLLDIFVDGKSATCNQLVEGEWVLSVVNFALEHWVEVLEVDVCIFYQRLS